MIKQEFKQEVISSVQQVIESDSSLVVLHDPAVDGPCDGVHVPLSESHLEKNVLAYLKSQFPQGLYSHQHEAVESVLNGKNTVVATRTSSGKSLIYSLPICDALCRDSKSTALFLYPQKALANDQQIKLRSMISQTEGLREIQEANPLLISRYDGSVPSEKRKAIRENSQIILTNPDMLHLGIMGHHDSNWSSFFRNLKIVAIDECHEYRGIFGTNVAYILHRLRQICKLHGSSPRFIATSATVNDPQGHMEQLTGLDFECINSDRDGSMQGKRKFWMVRSEDHHYDTGRKLAQKLADSGLTVLAFCPSRVSAERMISHSVKPGEANPSHVRVYRSGLSSSEREEIENGLRTKEVRLVFSTSALELGIDIGEIDVVIRIGLPHSMMSLWQRSGRSARGGREGATILIPAETPIDSYYANHPEELFGRENEALVLNLQNRRIACQHYACAAQEIGGDETHLDLESLGSEMNSIQELRISGKLNQDIFYCSEPHIEVNIRSGGERSFKLYDGDTEIGDVSYYHILRECYANAIYRHGGKTYRVSNILYGKKLIRLSKEYTPNETVPHLQRKIRLKNQFRIADYGDLCIATVSMDVTEYLLNVTERDRSGNVVMNWQGSSGMRQYRLPTEGTMLSFSDSFWSRLVPEIGPNPQAALCSMERLLTGLFPTISGPCDTQDYSSAVDRLSNGNNALFLYDTVYDGVDLTSAAFEKMRELIEKSIERVNACTCEGDEGCFRCIANPRSDESSSKRATLNLLTAILSVFMERKPSLITNESDWATAGEEAEINCNQCGHKISSNARFCSECGSPVQEKT